MVFKLYTMSLKGGAYIYAPNTFVMGDMPFGSYQVSDEQAVENAVRFFKEAETTDRKSVV